MSYPLLAAPVKCPVINICIKGRKNMRQGKSVVVITILVIAAVYVILVFVLVQMIRILENWSQVYP